MGYPRNTAAEYAFMADQRKVEKTTSEEEREDTMARSKALQSFLKIGRTQADILLDSLLVAICNMGRPYTKENLREFGMAMHTIYTNGLFHVEDHKNFTLFCDAHGYRCAAVWNAIRVYLHVTQEEVDSLDVCDAIKLAQIRASDAKKNSK